MPTPASASLIAATRDPDLYARAVALGATIGKSQADVEANLAKIVAAPLDGDATLAGVYEYAVASYEPTPPPGADLTKVTDALILEALTAVLGAPDTATAD